MRGVLFSLAIIICVTAHAQGFCALRNPKLHRDIIRAIIKASNWLKDQQDVEGKWLTYHTTGYAVSTLRLIGQGLNSENNCDGRPLVLDSFKKLNGTFHLVDGGKLAHIIIGLRSLCANTSNYMGNNLTDVLFKKILSYPMGSFSHPFQYALAVIALRLSNGTIPLSVVNKLINDGRTLDGLHGGDTMSLISMALSGIESQAALPRRKVWEVRRTGQKMLRKLKEAMFHENTTMNLYTKSLVMQAFAAANKNFRVSKKKCKALYEDLLRQQNPDGSFGTLSAVLHVLPALAATSFLDIPSVTCKKPENPTTDKKMIEVCVRVEFEVGNISNPPQQMVNILNGSTAFDALKEASKLDRCYGFTFKWTSWGPSIQSICKVKINHNKKYYWMFYVNNKMASVGVGSYKPKENECIVMKYQKLKW